MTGSVVDSVYSGAGVPNINTANNNNKSNGSPAVLSYSSSDQSVDYDTSCTPLYEAIGKSDWDTATRICQTIITSLERGETVANDAATWVVRYNQTSDKTEILWRFLPIHSTCALAPPHTFLRLLLRLHPSSVRTRDHQGLLPIHYACGARCSRECVYALLMSFPMGSMYGDPRGMLPLHYLGQWGPNPGGGGGGGGGGVVEMMLVATADLANARDKDGNTPLKLAQNASYPNHTDVANQIANHVMKKGLHLSNAVNAKSSTAFASPRSNGDKYSSFEDDITMDTSTHMDNSIKGSGNNGAYPVDFHGVGGGSPAMISFGDLLTDEEEGNGNETREMRRSTELSLGRDRISKRQDAWNKLGVSPVNNPNKFTLGHRIAATATASNNNPSTLYSPKDLSWDNRSILSDPLTSNSLTNSNHLIISSPRSSNGNDGNDATDTLAGMKPVNYRSDLQLDPTPKMRTNRSFSWDAQDPAAATINPLQEKKSHVAISSLHHQSPRSSLPPMSPRLMASSQRTQSSSNRSVSESYQETRDDRESTTRDAAGETPHPHLTTTHHSVESRQPDDKVSKEQFEEMRTAKEKTESEMRMLKMEKEQAEIQLKLSIDEKTRNLMEDKIRIQSSFEARLIEERRVAKERELQLEQEKRRLADREQMLNEEIEKGRTRIAELQSQIDDLHSKDRDDKNSSSERESQLCRELAEEKRRSSELERQLKDLEETIAKRDRSIVELGEEKKRLAECESKEIKEEKKRSAELEIKIKELEAKLNSTQKSQGESVYNHLQEVKSLRVSLEKATVEIEKFKAKSAEHSAYSSIERREIQMKQQESFAAKEDGWKREKSKLEGEIRSLTEISWGVQNSEHELKSELIKREGEVKQLKSLLKEATGINESFSVTSSLQTSKLIPASSNLSSDNHAHLQIQLENAMREADQMRKYNAAIRKEHGETINDIEGELEKERANKADLLSQIVSLQYKLGMLEQELEDAHGGGVEVSFYGTKKHRGSDDSLNAGKVVDTIRRDAEKREIDLLDQLSEARLHIKQLESEMYERGSNQSKEHALLQQLNAARDELNKRNEIHRDQVADLERKIRNMENMTSGQSGKEYSLLQQLNSARDELIKKDKIHRDQVANLEKKIRDMDNMISGQTSKEYSLLQQLNTARDDWSKKDDYYRDQVTNLEKTISDIESATPGQTGKEYSLLQDLNATRDELNKKNDYYHDQVINLEKKVRDLESVAPGQSSREKSLLQKLNAAHDELVKKDGYYCDQIADLERKIRNMASAMSGQSPNEDQLYAHQLRDAKKQVLELQEKEDGYLKEIRDLKGRIKDLEAKRDGHETQLWEAKKKQDWAIQEKEDVYNLKVREIKKDYEKTILDNQNTHLKEMRDLRKEVMMASREKEESYMEQLRDAKRREQALQEREDDLLKQIQDLEVRNSKDGLDIDGIIKRTEAEFSQQLQDLSLQREAEIADLTLYIEKLKLELKDKHDAEQLQKLLSECKKEFEKQRRKHKSELNKLNNTLELQKNKESRLQSHIKSMESQITSMVSDYESKLEEAYYENLHKK